MTDHTPSGLPQPQTVAAIERARKACYGRYGSDTTEINVGVLCELINALSAPAVETVAVQEAKPRITADEARTLNEAIRRYAMQEQKTAARKLIEALAAPLPVAPKAEPHPPWCSCGACNPEDASAQPVVADTLTDAQIIAAARTAKAAHWNLTDEGCLLIGRAVLALASPPRAIPAEQVGEALKNYRCTHFVDEDGGLPLADALAAAFGDKDVGRAMEEIDLIADAVYSEPRRTTT